jgi:uncharacterized membrane protein YphA (DoxX/SURF4 family)
MSTNAVSLEAPRNGALWVVQVFGAVLFFLAGLAKLSGDEQMIQTFAAIGVGQWLRYVTGLIELASAILFLIPALSGIVVLLVVPIMIGAIVTHVLVIGGSPAPAGRTSHYCECCGLGPKGNDSSIDLLAKEKNTVNT